MNTETKTIKEHTFDSADLHTLMELVDQQLHGIPVEPEAEGYRAFLQSLKDRVMALWADVLPGQEAVCTIREQKEEYDQGRTTIRTA